MHQQLKQDTYTKWLSNVLLSSLVLVPLTSVYILFEKELLKTMATWPNTQTPQLLLRILCSSIALLVWPTLCLWINKKQLDHSLKNTSEKNDKLLQLNKELLETVKSQEKLISIQSEQIKSDNTEMKALENANKTLLNCKNENREPDRVQDIINMFSSDK